MVSILEEPAAELLPRLVLSSQPTKPATPGPA